MNTPVTKSGKFTSCHKILQIKIWPITPLTIEAWHVNMNHDALNRDDGSYLPQEHLHIVGK